MVKEAKCLKIMSWFDAYAYPFQIKFQFRTLYQSFFGGIVSLFFYILLLFCIICLFIFFLNKDFPKIVNFNLKYEEPPTFTISNEISSILYEKNINSTGFFFFGFAFYNRSNSSFFNYSDSDLINYIDISVKLKKRINQSINQDSDSDIIPFNEDLKNNYSNILEKDNEILNYLYIFSDSNNIVLSGNYFSNIFNYFQIRFSTNSSVNENILNDVTLYIVYSTYSINYDTTGEKSPIKYHLQTFSIDFLKDFHINLDLYISYDLFESKENQWAYWSKTRKQNCYRISDLKRQYSNSSNNKPNRLITLNFRSGYYYKKIYRQYMDFFTFLSDIGGIWKVLIFIGSLIVFPINSSLMNVAISNKMFNMILPENNKDVLKTYDDYNKISEIRGKTPEIFQSINPVLQKICVDYYKFERNKGMNFSLKEALSKMFCCFCKIGYIEEKDKIFLMSNDEIKKRLEIKSSFKFIRKLRLIKNLKLGDECVLLGYYYKRNIYFENLRLIKNEYKALELKEKMNAISLAFQKQIFLVQGFNTLRNQGDLNKQDLLTIKLFKINKDLLNDFFILYQDKLKSIDKEKENSNELEDIDEKSEYYYNNLLTNEEEK
jgi:hypothetical protein